MTLPQPRSWEMRLAVTMVACGILLGLGVIAGALWLLTIDAGFLFAILPVVASFLLAAGLGITTFSAELTWELRRGRRGARLKVAVLGGSLCLTGLMGLAVQPLPGLLLLAYGGTLVWLMSTPAAERELGAWRKQLIQPPAPWGSAPGQGIWSSTPAQQGPWMGPPTKQPWLFWGKHSGPRAPWWQTWQAGLAQGIPLWELILLGVALVTFALGLLAVPAMFAGSLRIGSTWLKQPTFQAGILLIPASLAVVVWLERRMRQRLERR